MNNNVLSKAQKADLYISKGQISLQKGDIASARDSLDKAMELDINKRSYMLMNAIAVVTKDLELRNKAINGLKSLKVEEPEILLAEIKFDALDKDPEIVINVLAANGEMKNEYKENEDALLFAGVAALMLRKYEWAKKWINKSYELRPSLIKKFEIVIANLFSIINRREVYNRKFEDDKIELEANYKILLEMEEKINQYGKNFQIDYWVNRLIFNSYLDPKAFESEYKKIPELIRSNQQIQLIYAESMYLAGQIDSSNKIYEELYSKHKSSLLMTKLVIRLMESKNYEGVLELLKGIPCSDFDREGVVASALIESIHQKYGKDAAIKKGLELEQSSELELGSAFYEGMVLIYAKSGETPKIQEYINKTNSKIKADNYPSRFRLAKRWEAFGYLESAIEVLEPLIKYSNEVKLYFAKLLFRTKTKENLLKAKQLLAEMIRNNEDISNALWLQADIALDENDPKGALKSFKSAFENKKEEYIAVNIISIAISINEADDIEKYITFLRDSHDPKAMIAVARGYNFLKEPGLSETYALKALENLGERFDEDVFLAYIEMMMIKSDRDSNEKVDLDVVADNTAVRISDNKNIERWICINAERDLIKQQGCKFIGCEHFQKTSSLGLELLGKHINDNIIFDGGQYKIIEIIPRKVRAVRYCLDRYSKERPDSPYLKAVTINPENPLPDIIPFLQARKEREKFLLDQYNGANGVMGLPLFMLADNNVNHYVDAITSLLILPGQPYYAGTNQLGNIANEKSIVVSISSLFILRIYKQLNVLDEIKSKLSIAKSGFQVIESLFNEMSTVGQRTGGSMTIDEGGKPVFIEFSDKHKEGRLNFYKDILELLNKCHIHEAKRSTEEGIDAETLKNLRNLIGRFELESLFVAKELNATFVCDDNFVQKTARTINPNLKITNSISLLYKLLEENPSEYIKLIRQLSNSKYIFCCNSETIVKMVEKIKDIVLIDTQNNIEEDFREIIANLISTPAFFKDYWFVIKESLGILYVSRLNPRVVKMLGIMLREVKQACQRYKINTQYINNEFQKHFGLEILKAKYFIEYFNRL